MEYIFKELTREDVLLMKERVIEIQASYVPTMPWEPPFPDLVWTAQRYNDLYPDRLTDGEDILFALAFEEDDEDVEDEVEEIEEPVEEEPEAGDE